MNQGQVNNFVNVAREIAATCDYEKQFRHISIILSGKSIVAIGQNGNKTHTIAHDLGYKSDIVHSEVDAFSKIRYRSGSFTLLNFRFNRLGELRLSLPCKFCLPWCIEFFEEIWYSDKEGMIKI